MATKLHKICKVQSLASMQKIRNMCAGAQSGGKARAKAYAEGFSAGYGEGISAARAQILGDTQATQAERVLRDFQVQGVIGRMKEMETLMQKIQHGVDKGSKRFLEMTSAEQVQWMRETSLYKLAGIGLLWFIYAKFVKEKYKSLKEQMEKMEQMKWDEEAEDGDDMLPFWKWFWLEN